ncbi:hypothetical protein A2966_01710 [Candidatus Roizmanbacteria bacterium RIFCSPLOWO2_01_FULL_41_22]|uniref:Big-1 domain-containing protein n=2 Tax=Candidatus Roizmaniibacteriota TaxID=1752723 RepID=A0A1F7JQH9_9BACT|nr:MAG: hypothetical protein A2966_01710 [Candidatus Roizmanbacteria bacterium RIFCSPLOWO2_01_FULL_41_22]OGK57871.1 MAG: hypothetical protein A3H86_03970 [Candidatus Roizmanbacteria bacterium RIFCSPLOWO2_02_FULL_41_9]
MDKYLTGLVLIFLLAFTIFTSYVLLNKPLTRLTRATQTAAFKPENSLIFAWPLTLKADGEAATTVNVFVRTEEGDGLANKQVKLQTTLGIVKEAFVSSDQSGKTEFHVVSTTKGVAEIVAIVDNIKIPKSVSIKFE